MEILDEAAKEKMRTAGRLAAEVLEMIAPHVVAGVTTGELDDIMLDHIQNQQHAVSACLGYHGYPKATCISVNEVVCHGIPGIQHLHNGDIVNVDVTVIRSPAQCVHVRPSDRRSIPFRSALIEARTSWPSFQMMSTV